ncbi:MAG: hypothetical protein VB031_02065 [Eubacteriaceae bacterium]|nr:hypothetical protein [Eubacteriaceae bacterium]
MRKKKYIIIVLIIIAIAITFSLIKVLYYPVSLNESQKTQVVKVLENKDAKDDYVTYYHISFRGMKQKKDGQAELYTHFASNSYTISEKKITQADSSQGAMWILVRLDDSQNIQVVEYENVSKDMAGVTKEQFERFPVLLRTTIWGHSAKKYAKLDQQKAERYFEQNNN